MPYIHYIDVKVMNNVSRKALDWQSYKTAGHPCSLACLIMICSLQEVKHKEHNWRNGFFLCSGLESQPQSAVRMLNMQTVCRVLSAGKQQRTCCPLCAGVSALFLLDHDSTWRCCLWNEVTPTEGVLPLPHSLYSSCLLYKVCIWFPSWQERGRQILTLL
jgi:hypothetical protein